MPNTIPPDNRIFCHHCGKELERLHNCRNTETVPGRFICREVGSCAERFEKYRTLLRYLAEHWK